MSRRSSAAAGATPQSDAGSKDGQQSPPPAEPSCVWKLCTNALGGDSLHPNATWLLVAANCGLLSAAALGAVFSASLSNSFGVDPALPWIEGVLHNKYMGEALTITLLCLGGVLMVWFMGMLRAAVTLVSVAVAGCLTWSWQSWGDIGMWLAAAWGFLIALSLLGIVAAKWLRHLLSLYAIFLFLSTMCLGVLGTGWYYWGDGPFVRVLEPLWVQVPQESRASVESTLQCGWLPQQHAPGPSAAPVAPTQSPTPGSPPPPAAPPPAGRRGLLALRESPNATAEAPTSAPAEHSKSNASGAAGSPNASAAAGAEPEPAPADAEGAGPSACMPLVVSAAKQRLRPVFVATLCLLFLAAVVTLCSLGTLGLYFSGIWVALVLISAAAAFWITTTHPTESAVGHDAVYVSGVLNTVSLLLAVSMWPIRCTGRILSRSQVPWVLSVVPLSAVFSFYILVANLEGHTSLVYGIRLGRDVYYQLVIYQVASFVRSVYAEHDPCRREECLAAFDKQLCNVKVLIAVTVLLGNLGLFLFSGRALPPTVIPQLYPDWLATVVYALCGLMICVMLVLVYQLDTMVAHHVAGKCTEILHDEVDTGTGLRITVALDEVMTLRGLIGFVLVLMMCSQLAPHGPWCNTVAELYSAFALLFFSILQVKTLCTARANARVAKRLESGLIDPLAKPGDATLLSAWFSGNMQLPQGAEVYCDAVQEFTPAGDTRPDRGSCCAALCCCCCCGPRSVVPEPEGPKRLYGRVSKVFVPAGVKLPKDPARRWVPVTREVKFKLSGAYGKRAPEPWECPWTEVVLAAGRTAEVFNSPECANTPYGTFYPDERTPRVYTTLQAEPPGKAARSVSDKPLSVLATPPAQSST